MAATVYMHIGVPKTGTTTLQRFLAANRRLLLEKGYFYPDFGIEYPGIAKSRNGYFVSMTAKPWNQEECKKSYELLGEFGRAHEKIILSDEAIWNRQKPPAFWTKVRESFDAIGLDFIVIVYLRRQDALVEAFWNQRVKSKGKMTMTFEEFLQERYKFMPMAYDECLDRIVSEAKPKRLIVRVFERSQLIGGSVVDDFLEQIGLPLTSEFKMPEDVNASFSTDIVEVKRLINQNASYKDIEDFYYEAILGSIDDEMSKKEPKRSMFSPERRQSFMSAYEEGNACVAKKYLGRKGGELFYEASDVLQWTPDPMRMLSASVQVLSAADIMLYKRIKKLEKRAEAIYNSLPAKIYRKLKKAPSVKKDKTEDKKQDHNEDTED